MKRSPLKDKTFELAKLIVVLYKNLVKEQKEYVLSKQLLKSGTSPGAMIREAINAESKKDFVHKIKIAQKEIGETQYWLELLLDVEYLKRKEFDKANSLTTEIMKMIRSSVLTIKKNKN